MEYGDGLSVCVDGGDIVFRREGRASIRQYHLVKKDEDYIIRLLTGTPLEYFPKKAVINAIYKGRLKPSEYIGHMGYILNIVAYLILHNVEPLKPEYKHTLYLKKVYNESRKGLKESVLRKVISRSY